MTDQKSHEILSLRSTLAVSEFERKSATPGGAMPEMNHAFPIQLVVNYWEIRSSRIASELDHYLRQGVTQLACFIPWQAVESDISHALVRFIQGVAERKMVAALVLTPELGVNYSYSGLPKDLFKKPENLARHLDRGLVLSMQAPHAFALPSLCSVEFNKRYQSFLSRIDGVLADMIRQQPDISDSIKLVLGGSFWKYYRSPQQSVGGAYAGMTVDASGAASVAYRQCLDRFYSQREFQEPTPASSVRWKSRAMESINQRWFAQHSEELFRARSVQCVRRKTLTISSGPALRQIEIHSPEFDPSNQYSQFFSWMTGQKGGVHRLSSLLDESIQRASAVLVPETDHDTGAEASPFVHWSSVGTFRTLADSEKQFLLLKSILMMGGRGGGVLVDASEWFSLSASFRARAESLARSIQQGELRLARRATYLAPHTWSAVSSLWDRLQQKIGKVGANICLTASVDLASRNCDASLIAVDPEMIITREVLQKLIDWVADGRVLAIPRSVLYTDSARYLLEDVMSSAAEETPGMRLELGVSYTLQPFRRGKIIVYDLTEENQSAAWGRFSEALLSLADLNSYCQLSDHRLSVIALEKREGDWTHGLGLFLLNGTSRPVSGDLIFNAEVSVVDLASHYSGRPRRPGDHQHQAIRASRFTLEVPPFGVLPLGVEGVGLDAREVSERQSAVLASGVLQQHAERAAEIELSGMGSTGDFFEELSRFDA